MLCDASSTQKFKHMTTGVNIKGVAGGLTVGLMYTVPQNEGSKTCVWLYGRMLARAAEGV